jgi:general secretion pathway protein D
MSRIANQHTLPKYMPVWLCLRVVVCLVLVSSCLTPGVTTLQAQTQLSDRASLTDEMRAKLVKPGNLVLRDTNFVEALFAIKRVWNINIVAGNELRSETVNCEFTDTPLYEILDSILGSRGYGYRPLGNSLIITKLDDTDAMKPLFQSVTLPMDNITADEAVPALELYLSKHGKIQPIPSAKRIMVLDFPERIALIQEKLTELDKATKANNANSTRGASGNGTGANGQQQGPSLLRVVYFRPQYVKAESLQTPFQQLLSAEGRLGVIPKDNRLVVMDTAEKITLLTEALRTLDVPRPQVRIAALIYDASIEDLERCGVNWNTVGKGSNLGPTGLAQDAVTLGTITAAAPPAGAANGALTFMSLGSNFDLNSVVNALATMKDSRLLADPNVTVVDQETAKIEIVTEIPIQQLTQSSGGGNIGTTTFREAGVTLNVTPMIAHDGTIQMVVNPKFSLLTGFTPGTAQPIIDRRETTTTVRVANRQTIALGGLRQRSSINENSGIPYLKDIKFLGIGHLFQNRNDTKRDSELLVFLTPELMDFSGFTRPRDQETFWAAQNCLDGQPSTQLPVQCNGPNCAPCQTGNGTVVQQQVVNDRVVGPNGAPVEIISAPSANYPTQIAPPVNAPLAPMPSEAAPVEVLPPITEPTTKSDQTRLNRPAAQYQVVTSNDGSTARIVIPRNGATGTSTSSPSMVTPVSAKQPINTPVNKPATTNNQFNSLPAVNANQFQALPPLQNTTPAPVVTTTKPATPPTTKPVAKQNSFLMPRTSR